MAVTEFSPAKINLYLAVTGRRADGFHDLVSVVAALDFGDELTATMEAAEGEVMFRLTCDQPELPVDDTNLVLKAARAFAGASGWPAAGGGVTVAFHLIKRIPVGAGLGGGSSNGVAALKALNRLAPVKLAPERLEALAAGLGSDCAFFVSAAPAVMRGRGERLERLGEGEVARLRGQRLLVFKPSFGISTPWAYGRMAAEAPGHYLAPPAAERQLSAWREGNAPLAELLFNGMEGVAFAKYHALPVLLTRLRQEFGVAARMSGSGSACFALLGDASDGDVTQMKQVIHASWGAHAFVQTAALVEFRIDR